MNVLDNISAKTWTNNNNTHNVSMQRYYLRRSINIIFFIVRLLSVLRVHSFFFIPATTANDLRLQRIFYPRLYSLHLSSYLNSWERSFPFECSVLNKGTTGTIFRTSLVWRGPWLGIEPGTSRTRSQYYTTRLSRRRCLIHLNHCYDAFVGWKRGNPGRYSWPTTFASFWFCN